MITVTFDQATLLDLTPVILQESIRCLERSPLKASDAIHVASALTSGCDLFVSADRRQCAAARTLGLSVAAIDVS